MKRIVELIQNDEYTEELTKLIRNFLNATYKDRSKSVNVDLKVLNYIDVYDIISELEYINNHEGLNPEDLETTVDIIVGDRLDWHIKNIVKKYEEGRF